MSQGIQWLQLYWERRTACAMQWLGRTSQLARAVFWTHLPSTASNSHVFCETVPSSVFTPFKLVADWLSYHINEEHSRFCPINTSAYIIIIQLSVSVVACLEYDLSPSSNQNYFKIQHELKVMRETDWLVFFLSMQVGPSYRWRATALYCPFRHLRC